MGGGNNDSVGLVPVSRFSRYFGRGPTSADNIRSVMGSVLDRRSMCRYGSVRFIAHSPEAKGGMCSRSITPSFDSAVLLRTSREQTSTQLRVVSKSRAKFAFRSKSQFPTKSRIESNREPSSSCGPNRNRLSSSSTDQNRAPRNSTAPIFHGALVVESDHLVNRHRNGDDEGSIIRGASHAREYPLGDFVGRFCFGDAFIAVADGASGDE